MGPADFAMSYFEGLGCQMLFASNPADWMLDMITSTTVSDEEALCDYPTRFSHGIREVGDG